MNSRMWLLVDWVDEGNDSPVYGIVNIDITAYTHIAMVPGNVIFIRTRHSAPRLAMIMDVSDCINNIKKQKALLKRQERMVAYERCMQTINEIRSEDSSNFMGASRNSRNFSRFTPTFNSRHNRMPSMGTQSRDALTANSSRQRSIVCSTPLPSSSSQQFRSLTINRTTQTDMLLRSLVKRIEMLEETTNNLNRQLLSKMSQATANPSTAESNSIEYVQQSSGSSSSSGFVKILADEEMVSSNGGSIGVDQEQHNNSNDSNPNIVRVRRVSVRRVSAQTTSNIEPVRDLCDDDLVRFGNSQVLVPRRLLNNIDWNSCSSATRQLLRAIFPRRVLATSTLTGKRSPAFLNMNKPAKKTLNPSVVKDIVTIVATRCDVRRSNVRHIITQTCLCEAKSFRNRQRRRQLGQSRNNEENLRLSASSSD